MCFVKVKEVFFSNPLAHTTVLSFLFFILSSLRFFSFLWNVSQDNDYIIADLISKISPVARCLTTYQPMVFVPHLITFFALFQAIIYVMMIKEGCSRHAVERLLCTSKMDPQEESDEDDD